MLLDRIIALYDTEPDLLKRRQPGKGNPTASAAGKCAAQMQMLRFPEITHPEARSARSAWSMEDGDLHAADLKAKMNRAFPGLTGLEEELFYFPVPVTPAQEAALQSKIQDRSLWGSIMPGFKPPRVRAGNKIPGHPDERDMVRLAPRDNSGKRPRALGFIVDPGSGVFWAPLYVDQVVRLPVTDDYPGVTVVEYKSMSEYAFRRAAIGEMGYTERIQLASIAAATGLDVLWICKRKNTAHTLEIGYKAGLDRIRVTLLKANGQREVMFVQPDGAFVNTEGVTVEPPRDNDWETGQVWTPYDDSLLQEARDRILRVLLFDARRVETQALPYAWYREYGPDFLCGKCGGRGTRTCGYCKGTGVSSRSKDGKPCGAKGCGATGRVPCDECDGGILDQAPLKFPCTYCPTLNHCWALAKPALTVSDRPSWVITRENYEASGLTYYPPSQPAAPEPVPEEVTPEA